MKATAMHSGQLASFTAFIRKGAQSFSGGFFGLDTKNDHREPF